MPEWGIALGTKAYSILRMLQVKGDVINMITREEKVIFEYEIKKLTDEYQNCAESRLKKRIQEDALWLKSIVL